MAPTSTPEFSIVVPTYNRWPLIAETVESVLALRGPTFEVIVVDDGSTDGTADRLEERFPDVTVVRQRNAERGAARNAGVARASGRWVTFVDSDDVLLPNHLGALRRGLAEGASAVATMGALWDPQRGPGRIYGTAPIGGSYSFEQTIEGNPILICCLALTPERFWAAGGFPEEREVAGSEDWVLMLRLLSMEPIPALPDVTAHVREHDGRSMADPTGIVRSREAATELLLRSGLPGRQLDAGEARRLRAGSAYFAAAHLYEAGRMPEARRRMAEVVEHLGLRHGTAKVARLWAQSLLGGRITTSLRARRRRARG